jgi:hypothetical protein
MGNWPCFQGLVRQPVRNNAGVENALNLTQVTKDTPAAPEASAATRPVSVAPEVESQVLLPVVNPSYQGSTTHWHSLADTLGAEPVWHSLADTPAAPEASAATSRVSASLEEEIQVLLPVVNPNYQASTIHQHQLTDTVGSRVQSMMSYLDNFDSVTGATIKLTDTLGAEPVRNNAGVKNVIDLTQATKDTPAAPEASAAAPPMSAVLEEEIQVLLPIVNPSYQGSTNHQPPRTDTLVSRMNSMMSFLNDMDTNNSGVDDDAYSSDDGAEIPTKAISIDLLKDVVPGRR